MLCTSGAYEELKETSRPLILTSCWVVLGPFFIPPGLANTSAMENEPRAFTAVQVPGFWEAGTTLTPAHGSCSQSRFGGALCSPLRDHGAQSSQGGRTWARHRRKHTLAPSLLFPAKHPPPHVKGTAGAGAPAHHRKDRRGCWPQPPRLLSLLGRARWKLGWVSVTPEARPCFRSFFYPKKFPS